MNQKAAEIAWEIAMEHNRVFQALTSVVSPTDDDDYTAAKQRAFRIIYRIVTRVIDTPTTDYAKEFLSRTLDKGTPDEWRPVPLMHLSDLKKANAHIAKLQIRVKVLEEAQREEQPGSRREQGSAATAVRAEDVLAKARSMQVNPPNLNEACAEIAILQSRLRLLEKTLQQACIELP